MLKLVPQLKNPSVEQILSNLSLDGLAADSRRLPDGHRALIDPVFTTKYRTLEKEAIELTLFQLDYSVAGPQGRVIDSRFGYVNRSNEDVFIVGMPFRRGVLLPSQLVERPVAVHAVEQFAGSNSQEQHAYAAAYAIHRAISEGIHKDTSVN